MFNNMPGGIFFKLFGGQKGKGVWARVLDVLVFMIIMSFMIIMTGTCVYVVCVCM